MNKSFHNAIPTILFVALAVFLGRAQGCGLFHTNAFEDRCANMVELCPACLQHVDGNYTGLHSYGTNGYSRDSVDEDAVLGGRMADEDQGQELDTKIYEVRPSAGKGFGVFATKLITRGTQIIVEEPLVSVAMPEMVAGKGFKMMDMLSDLEREFQALSPEQQADFLQLHDFRFASEDKQSHLLTIFRSNAFNTGDKHVGLFPTIARINHSCRPNSGNWWSEKQGHRVIYAALDIQEGEEVTVSYIPLLKKSSERQQRLGQYGFTCDCPACQSEPGESDKRRVKISRLLETLEQRVYHPSMKADTNEKSIDKALSLIEMIEEEGLADYLHRAFKLAALFNKIGGHFEDAEMWARKALEILQWAEQGSIEAREILDFMESLAPGNLKENSIL